MTSTNPPPEENPDDTKTPPAGTRTQPAEERRPIPRDKPARTRLSSTWVAIIVAVLLLIFLLIFILQNLDEATVHFLGASGTLPLGVALLFSAITGALLVALVGSARILQLRRHPGGKRK